MRGGFDMKKIAVTAETTIDLPKELLEKYDIKIVPFTFVIKDEIYTDGTFPNEELFKKVEESGELPRTQAVNEYQYDEFFKEILKEYDAIIHFSLSSGISSSCEHAILTAKKYKNVFVVDTLSLSTGIALLALQACELRDKGIEAKEIYETTLKTIPNIVTSFMIDKVDYLYKGGRCSLLAFIGASVLGLKPQIIMKAGKLFPGKKYRGKFEKAILNYVDDVLTEHNDLVLDTAFVTYTTAPDETIQRIIQILKNRGFKNVLTSRAGCTIASHCGPNTLGILYIEKGK